MNKRIFTPKQLVNAFRDYEVVGLKHLKTRLDKGFFIPYAASTGQGTKTLYDLEAAMQYGAAIILEDMGFNIDDAAFTAFLLINMNFYPNSQHLWVITVGTSLKNYRTFIRSEYGDKQPPYYIKGDPEKEEKWNNAVSYIEPWHDIVFHLPNDWREELEKSLGGKIGYLKFLNISHVIKECCERFKLTEDEIELLARQSMDNQLKPSDKILELSKRFS